MRAMSRTGIVSIGDSLNVSISFPYLMEHIRRRMQPRYVIIELLAKFPSVLILHERTNADGQDGVLIDLVAFYHDHFAEIDRAVSMTLWRLLTAYYNTVLVATNHTFVSSAVYGQFVGKLGAFAQMRPKFLVDGTSGLMWWMHDQCIVKVRLAHARKAFKV